jgi:hypothetical protein
MLMSRQVPLWLALSVGAALFGCGGNTTATQPHPGQPTTKAPHDVTDGPKATDKDKPAASPKQGSTSSGEKSNAAAFDFSKLKFKLPDGWKAQYSPILSGDWVIEKYITDAEGIGRRNSIFCYLLPDYRPSDFDAYAAKVKEQGFVSPAFVWTDVTSKEKLPDGFLIRGAEKADGETKSEPTFVVVRNINGTYIYFTFGSERTPSETILTEAIDIAKSAHIASPK